MTSAPEEFATFLGSVSLLNFCLRESLNNYPSYFLPGKKRMERNWFAREINRVSLDLSSSQSPNVRQLRFREFFRCSPIFGNYPVFKNNLLQITLTH